MKKCKILAVMLSVSIAMSQISPMAVMAAEYENGRQISSTVTAETDWVNGEWNWGDDADRIDNDSVMWWGDAEVVTYSDEEAVSDGDDITLYEMEAEDGADDSDEAEVLSETAAENETAERPAPGTTVRYNDQITYVVNDDGETCSVGCTSQGVSGTVEIPSELDGLTVTEIAAGGFANCNNLEQVILPDTLTTIGASAFCSAGLTELNIPASVTKIDFDADLMQQNGGPTLGCPILQAINVDADNTEYKSVDGVLFNHNQTTLLAYPAVRLGAYDLPEGVTTIGTFAFYFSGLVPYLNGIDESSAFSIHSLPETLEEIGAGAFYLSSLSSITISENVRNISGDPLTNDMPSFLLCPFLQEINVAEENTAFTSSDGVLYNKDMTYLLQYPIGSQMTEYEMPDSVRAISAGAFDEMTLKDNGIESKLEKLKCSSNLEFIARAAFAENYNLKEIELPVTLKTVADYAFDGTTALTDVYYGGTENDKNQISIGNSNTNLLNATWHYKEPETIPDGVSWKLEDGVLTVSGKGAMDDYSYQGQTAPWYNDRDKIKKICVEEGVTSIGDCAFYNIPGEFTVELPESLTRIGYGAFLNCSNLWAIQIPENVSYIGERSFENCDRATLLFKTSELPKVLYPGWNGSDDKTAQTVVNVSEAGETEDGFMYYLTGDGYAGVYRYLGKEGMLTIPDTIENLPVKKISTAAFMGNSGICDVTIPDTVEVIDYHAFYGCSDLYRVYMPKNLVSIGESAFENCKALLDIELYDKVEEIGESAFAKCAEITSVTVPNGVTELKNSVFSGCTSLQDVTLSENITTIDKYAFSNCSSLKKISLPESLQKIDYQAFKNTGLKSINIPKNVTYCDTAFENCDDLKFVQIDSPYIAKNVGTNDDTSHMVVAEYLCKYADTVIFPTSVEEVSTYIIENFTNVMDVKNHSGDYKVYSNHEHDWNPEEWDGEPELGYEECVRDGYVRSTCLICDLEMVEWRSAHLMSGDWTVTKEATCTENGEKVRECVDCGYIESEIIPATGHHFVDGKCTNCGKTEGIEGTCGEQLTWTLQNDGLLTISGSGKMTNYTSIKSVPWYDYVGQIKKVVIEKGVTSIGNFAFYGLKDIQKVTVPKGVEIIGDYAFKGCTGLENIELPKGLWKIGESAFYGCQALKAVNMPDTITVMGAYAFKGCSSVESVHISKELYGINESAFYGCQSLKQITIPEGIKRIDGYVFKNCSGLQTVELPSTLAKLGESAFYGCSSVTELTIPANVTVINGYTFKNCTSLKAIQLPENLTSVGEAAFYGCTGLAEITIPDSVTKINGYAFKNCTGLSDIQLSEKLETIGESAFYGCTGLTEVTIPQQVKKINGYAFARSTSLKKINFTGDAPAIDSYAFSKVTADAKYPADNTTWTADKRQNYGGKLTWSEK